MAVMIRVAERLNHRYDLGPPRGCPMTALTCAADPEVPADDASARRDHTPAPCETDS